MAMNELRELGTRRVRRMPPPGLLDDIRRSGRRRIRLAAVGGGATAVLISAGIVAGVAGAERAAGDRLTPARPQPSPSAVQPQPHQAPARVAVGPPAGPWGSAPSAAPPSPGGQPASAGAVPFADAPVAEPYGPAEPAPPPTGSPTPSPSPSADTRTPGVQDRTLVHRGLSACDVRTTPSGYCGRVTTTQSTGLVTIVTEVCWSNGNTGNGTLTFDTTLQTDDVISRGGSQVWDWSADKSFAEQPETLTLQPGDCFDWSAQWRPPSGSASGTYDVQGRSYATELASGQDRWTATFTLP